MRCLGIYRERQNSPNRETDDALILRAALEQLALLKVETALMEPEESDRQDLAGWDMIIPMCESYARIMRLKALAERSRTIFINAPDSVLGCYRVRMLESFWKTPGLNVPETEIRQTSAVLPFPAFGANGVWAKRGDVHNTCLHDVVFARDSAGVDVVRRDFEQREISHLLLQRHVDGDIIKFYGVGPGQWFTWFYHDPQSARRLPFELEELARQAEAAANAVGLEVFGGDAIISAEGPIFIIDINSWPSFARVRPEASVQIARRLQARLHDARARSSTRTEAP
jgi:hypothetical protein